MRTLALALTAMLIVSLAGPNIALYANAGETTSTPEPLLEQPPDEDPPSSEEETPADEPEELSALPMMMSAPSGDPGVAEVTVADWGQPSIEGWQRVPQERWTSGNINPQNNSYYEGDWVSFRVTWKNPSTSTDEYMPELLLGYNYCGTQGVGEYAIGYDDVGYWQYYTVAPKQEPQTDEDPAPSTAVPADAVSYDSNVYTDDGQRWEKQMTVAGGRLLVPAGETIVVNFKLHMAVTEYYQAFPTTFTDDDGRVITAELGAAYYAEGNGNMQVWFEDYGNATSPGCSAAAPTGTATIFKYEELNGVPGYQVGVDVPLEGRSFTIKYLGAWPLTRTGTTGADGMLVFTGLPVGSYTLDEVDDPAWMLSDPAQLPTGFAIAWYDLTYEIAIGNISLTPSIEVTKEASPETYDAVGDVITYTITVKNIGNVTLSGITVDDPLLSDEAYVSGDTDADGKLDVDETWTYTGTYTVTQADLDAGGVYNSVTAEAYDPNEEPVTGEDDEEVPADQNPAVAITKTADVELVDTVGDQIVYTITIKNIGNVTLYNIVVTDPKVTLLYVSGDTDGDGELDVGESWSYTGTYVVTQADLDAGEVLNVATVTADDPNEEEISEEDTETVPAEPFLPFTEKEEEEPFLPFTGGDFALLLVAALAAAGIGAGLRLRPRRRPSE